VDQISELLFDQTFTCKCQTLRGTTESPLRDVPLRAIKGSLFVQLTGVRRDELVRLVITAGTRVWRSSYESVDTVDIQLKGKE
jgi:hypothetical protein